MSDSSASYAFKTFAALIVLTLLTTAVSFLQFGKWNLMIALSIAIVKASLVILFFMHLYKSKHLPKLFIGASLFWLILLIGITFGDYATRGGSHQIPAHSWIQVSAARYAS